MQYLSLITSFNLPFDNNILLPRRNFLTGVAFPGYNFNLISNIKDSIKNKNQNIIKEDNYAHWSIYGLVPPPIEKSISYNELIESIKNGTIIYTEKTIQHDCIVATTNKNHRWASLIKDSDIPTFLEDIKDKNGNQLVMLLPPNPNKVKIRNAAQVFFYAYIIRFIALDIPYNYKLIREVNKMNMTFKEKMFYLSNKTTNLNLVDLLNDTFIN